VSAPFPHRAPYTRRPAPRQEWAARAACASHPDPDLWFDATDDLGSDVAIAVCAICPVRHRCLEYALSVPRMPGIWGGTTPAERARLRRRSRRHST
jgi:WhiB family transcriptional regulator, redox-sensing transcriptional regulator